MSAISLKSITGITSITTPAGVDNQLTLHTNNTTERLKIDVAGNVHVNNQLAVAGVTTFASNVNLGDNDKLIIGDHGDIQIYNDGTKSVIKNGGSSLGGNNNSLHFYSQNDILTNTTYSQYFHCGATNESSVSPRQLALIRNEGVKAYYNNDLKLETSPNGVDITGGLTVSGISTFTGTTNFDNGAVNIINGGGAYNTHLNYNDIGTNYITSANGTGTYFRGSSNGVTAMAVQGAGPVDIDGDLRHLGDTDTMLQFGTNTISLKTAGSERLRIDSAGRLLIGTATTKSAGSGQYAKLNVEGYAGGSECFASFSRAEAASAMSANDEVANLTFNDSAGYEFARIQVLADAATGATDTPGRMVFRTTADSASSSTERLRIDSSGRLLIGNTTGGSMNAAADNLVVGSGVGHNGITVFSAADADGWLIFNDAANSNLTGSIQYNHVNNYMEFRTNASPRLRIDSSGRVLIGGGSSPSQVGDARLLVYSDSRLHPAIKADCIDGGVNRANGYTIISDNYAGDESQVNLGVSYSSSGLVLSRGVKVSNAADDTYLSSQDSYAMRPCAIKLDDVGAFNFLTTETNATTTTDSAVSLTEVFKIDRVGNIYQKISARYMYFGASNQLRIGVQGNGDSNIEAVTGDLKIMDAGSVITQVRSDGLENFQHVYPAADNSKDLGKSSRRWANIYTTDLHLSNEGKSNVVDGTWGDWTLQEGEHKIYMINNRTGKKYSLKMEEE